MKAVTDTKYYDEIAKRIDAYGYGVQMPIKPSAMAKAVETLVVNATADWYNQGETDGRETLENEILGGAW